MSKKDLIDAISVRTGMTKVNSETALNAVVEARPRF